MVRWYAIAVAVETGTARAGNSYAAHVYVVKLWHMNAPWLLTGNIHANTAVSSEYWEILHPFYWKNTKEIWIEALWINILVKFVIWADFWEY